MFNAISLTAALLLQATPAEPACPTAAAPTAELAGWSTSVRLDAGRSGKTAPLIPIGRGIDAALAPTLRVGYVVRPEKPGGSVSHGGMFAFTVTTAGRYRVALGSGAWIDVVRDGAPAASVAHGHGPACTGIRKMVDFDLAPGRYMLQVAGNGTARLPLMVARLAE